MEQNETLNPKMKAVVQLDVDGWYLGMTMVDEDPMNPGEFLMPDYAFVIDPPTIQDGHKARWANGSWSYELITVPVIDNYDLALAQAPVIIDQSIDVIYQQVIGQRGPEYLSAEGEAQAYADAEFEGDVPVTVQDWADITGLTTQEAAENILTQAAMWRQMSTVVMRKGRLTAKEQVRNVTNIQELNTVMLTWKATVAGYRVALGLEGPTS